MGNNRHNLQKKIMIAFSYMGQTEKKVNFLTLMPFTIMFPVIFSHITCWQIVVPSYSVAIYII